MSDPVHLERPDSFSLRDFYYILFRHKTSMALFFVAVVAFVAFSSYSQVDLYTSDAKLLMRMGRDDANLDPTLSQERAGPGRTLQNEINTELEIIKSRELMQTVVADIGVDWLLSPNTTSPVQNLKTALAKFKHSLSSTTRADTTPIDSLTDPNTQSDTLTEKAIRRRVEGAISTILANLKVSSMKDTSVITFSYESPDPNLAQAVLGAVIDRYLERHITIHQTPGSLKFFEEQSSQFQTQLEKAETDLKQLKDSSGISSVEGQRNTLIQRIGAINQSIATALAALAASPEKTELSELAMEAIPKKRITSEQAGITQRGLEIIESRIFQLQLQEQDQLSKYKEDSEPVKRIRQQVANAQAILNEKQDVALMRRVDGYKTQLVQAQEDLRTINAVEVQMAKLQRNVDMFERNYRKYSEKLEDAHIDQTLRQERISNISIIQTATLPLSPAKSKVQLYLTLAVLMGLFGSFSLAFMAEQLDHSINTPEQVAQRMQLPTLASIPRLHKSSVAPTPIMGKKTHPKTENGKMPLAEWRVADEITDIYEAIGEQIIDAQDGDTRVFGIVSSLRGEGVTSVAANLSTNLAKRAEGLVLLADADADSPAVRHVFNKQLAPKLASNIKAQSDKDKDTVFSLGSEDLRASRIANSARDQALPIGNSDQFAKFINEVKKDYDYVILDLPAALVSSPSIKLASLCDKVILVVEAGRTRWEILQRTTAQLQKQNANLMGVILNKRRYPIPDWVYRRL